jgi:hypothetical protein
MIGENKERQDLEKHGLSVVGVLEANIVVSHRLTVCFCEGLTLLATPERSRYMGNRRKNQGNIWLGRCPYA